MDTLLRFNYSIYALLTSTKDYNKVSSETFILFTISLWLAFVKISSPNKYLHGPSLLPCYSTQKLLYELNFNFLTALTSIFPTSSIESGKSFTSMPYQIIIAIGRVAILASVQAPQTAPAFYGPDKPSDTSTLTSTEGIDSGCFPRSLSIFIPKFGVYSIGGCTQSSGYFPNNLLKSTPNLGFYSVTTGISSTLLPNTFLISNLDNFASTFLSCLGFGSFLPKNSSSTIYGSEPFPLATQIAFVLVLDQ